MNSLTRSTLVFVLSSLFVLGALVTTPSVLATCEGGNGAGGPCKKVADAPETGSTPDIPTLFTGIVLGLRVGLGLGL